MCWRSGLLQSQKSSFLTAKDNKSTQEHTGIIHFFETKHDRVVKKAKTKINTYFVSIKIIFYYFLIKNTDIINHFMIFIYQLFLPTEDDLLKITWYRYYIS